MPTDVDLPLAPVERILRKAGAERVSGAAVKELTAFLEKEAYRIAARALELARHAGRKTVKEEDIKTAIKV